MDSSLIARVTWWANHVAVITGSGQRIDWVKKSARWGWGETLATEWNSPHHFPFPCHSRKYHISGFSVLHVSFCSLFFPFPSFPLLLFQSCLPFFSSSCFPPSLHGFFSSYPAAVVFLFLSEGTRHSTMLYFVWMPNGADSLSVGGHVGIELKKKIIPPTHPTVFWL